jgi:predicted MFS family arabinose efflux permease
MPLFGRVLAVSWFMSASWDVHSFVVPVLGNQRGLSASAIGSVLGVFALAVTAVRLLIPVLAHRLGEAQVLTAAMVLVASVFAIYPLASSVWTMTCCATLLGLALGSAAPMVMTRLHQITPPHRQGEAIALRSMANNFSSSVMPLCFGALGTALGTAGLFWMMGTLVLGGAFVARSIRSSDVEPLASPR